MKRIVLIALMMGADGLMALQILTDNDVVRMVQAGVAQDLILKLIAESPAQFGLQPEHVIAWKKAGVPDDVARAMLVRNRDGSSIQYVRFSSEVRVVPAKRSRKKLARLKIWR